MQWMMRTVACAAAMMVAGSALAQSADGEGRVSLGVTAGTLGVGPEIGYRVNQHVGVRANSGFLGIDHSFTADGIDYRGHARLRSGGVIVDVYPFGGGFRLSGGARYNGNEARVRARPTGSTQIGDRFYTPTEIGTITGYADVREFVPQLTLGYGGGLRKGVSFNIEAGALFQGAVRIRDFTSNGTLATDQTIAGTTYRTELGKQQRRLQDRADDYPVYPILQVGVKYRF